MSFIQRLRSAFTLAELIVVITILAILSTIGFLALSGYTEDASRSATQTKIRMLASAVSAESTSANRSVRSYAFRVPDVELADAVLFSVPLVAGSYGDPDTNYTAGVPKYEDLKLNPEKFRSSFRKAVEEAAASSELFLAAADIEDATGGKIRLRSYFQVAQQLNSGEWTVTGNLPIDDESTAGLFRDPENPEDASAAIVDSTLTAVADITIPPSVADVYVGQSSTCALSASGGSYCWGYNYNGQLGIGTNVDVNTPTLLTGLTGTASLRVNQYHGCAITASGGAKCWGYNLYGQLGNGTNVDSNVPVDVAGLSSGVTEIAVGQNHTCAIVSGTVKCWGYGASGRLGNGATANSNVPVTVNLGEQAKGLSLGATYGCAATVSGGVKCWGNSAYGQLGNGTTVATQSTPVAVTGLSSGVVKISSQSLHTCALTDAGAVKCWGRGFNGQLGNGLTDDAPIPVDPIGMSSGIKDLSVAASHTCVLTESGGMKCWGANSYGQLGNGSKAFTQTGITDVYGLTSGIRKISAGGTHSCALMDSGVLKCWGLNHVGQLGNRIDTGSRVPLDNPYLTSGVSSITFGGSHACALTSAGGIKCWGANSYGQLGNSTVGASSVVPVDVDGLASGVAMVSAGGNHTCALTTAGGVKCWGYNFYGQIGNSSTGITVPVPYSVPGLTSGVAKIRSGVSGTCAVMTTGELKCWGRNNYGQLGDGTKIERSSPVTVSGATSGVADVSMGGSHSCLLTTAGGAKCWGYNSYYGLGDGTKTLRLVPTSVTGATSGIAEVYAGNNHYSCFRTTAGEVKCTGRNNYGQQGNGTMADSTVPTTVVGLSTGVDSLSVGNAHSCVKMADGTAKCWGYNAQGQLGNGQMTISTVPIETTPPLSSISSIVVGISGNDTCVLTTAGAVKCWGNNSSGQIGKDPGTVVPGDVTNW